MKKRKLTLLISIFAVLAMISVGFAAWVITNNAEASDEGNVRVDVVEDKRLGITAAIKDDELVIFGAKNKDAAVEYNWLKNEDTGLNENLTIYVVLTVDNYSYLQSSAAIKITVTEKEGQTLYADALAKNYVAVLPEISLSKAQLIAYAVAPYEAQIDSKQARYDDYVADPSFGAESDEAKALLDEIKALQATVEKIENEEAARLECEIPVQWSWGTAFNGKNPIDYYNGFAYTNELGDAAFAALEELQNLDEAKYILKVEAFTK